MAALTWQRIRAGMTGTSSRQDEGLRQVAVRLATQTVVLLLVMLIALEVVVYVITQQALLGSLETTLADRTNIPTDMACGVFHLPCGHSNFPGGAQPPSGPEHGHGPGGPGAGPGGAPPPNPDLNPSDASLVFVDSHLHILHADGALGKVLLDPTGVQQALRTNHPQCCTVHAYRGQDYLVYTKSLKVDSHTVGAVQSSISEHQYEQTMRALLQALLVVAVLGLLISGGISVVLVRRALHPVRVAVQRQRDFVADAAHELRTPLAIQRTVGEVGIAAPGIDELQATVAQMLSENQHLTRLVEDLSLLARTDTNTMSIDRRPVALSSLIAETVAELSPVAGEQGVALDATVHGEISVSGDLLRLRQLLLILLDNALKHTPDDGQVHVDLAEQGGRARLQVIDSGPGIPPADLPHIFDRFYRADRAREGEGTGLGLAIAKWIVEAHGGQIQASNALPHGAVFTVTLPIARSSTPA